MWQRRTCAGRHDGFKRRPVRAQPPHTIFDLGREIGLRHVARWNCSNLDRSAAEFSSTAVRWWRIPPPTSPCGAARWCRHRPQLQARGFPFQRSYVSNEISRARSPAASPSTASASQHFAQERAFRDLYVTVGFLRRLRLVARIGEEQLSGPRSAERRRCCP